ncbi:hypothetical protein A2Z23_02850 [Candidatus Curtissbacteria bacterium RBG_16_39_7]|uniref:Transglycosylase SLT domain-containing protein n=1 Tax=Candidatus Curtissbacteria bacterium RBG_16_39_7 TaxID=1797707 RepID=A0A1F5G4J1_9BACT|nr:MAG: hypothetical protein A2Z23_02850 [Candidatus Curtissbacteria bacterium RBG_16_39_7]
MQKIVGFFKENYIKILIVAVLVSGASAVTVLALLKLLPLEQKDDQSIILLSKNEAKAVFHDLTADEEKLAENIAREQIRLIVSKPQFFPSLTTIQKYEEEIRKQAEARKIQSDIILGLALLENGGSEKEISSSGAAGIFQLIERTARGLGLTVAEGNDERLIPEKNISAALLNFDNNLKLFSDIGLAVWAHHAGPQNVSQALKIYLSSIGEKDAFNLSEAEKLGNLDRAKYVWRAYVTKDGLNIHRLLQNPQVKLFVVPTLSDETEFFPYKIVASAILYKTAKSYPNQEIFKQKVELFNQGRILLSELLTQN